MRRNNGQSMVEMALLLPLLLLLIFGIIDLGWYVFNYATINQAVRNGSEVAAQLPPYETVLASTSLQKNDPCYQTIVAEVQRQVILPVSDKVTVTYPDASLSVKRAIGNPIQVQVIYAIQPLTPLFKLIPISGRGVFTFTSQSRRSIEGLGFIPPSVDHPNGLACATGS